jgi:hypothetical protein
MLMGENAADGAMPGQEVDSALQEAVTTVERVGEVLQVFTAEQWRAVLSAERRQALEAEAAASFAWALVVVKQAIAVAQAASAGSTARGELYGPITRAEALAHFRYLLEHVAAAAAATTAQCGPTTTH